MPGQSYSTLALLYVILAFCTCLSYAVLVDNATSCDQFATRTTINATYDECLCGADFTGNGTFCALQARLDCTSDVVTSGFAFKVFLNRTYIDSMGIDTSNLRLLNESCNNVTVEGGYYVLQSPEYDECGSVLSNSSNATIYSNAVLSNGGGISTGEILNLEFSCFVSTFLSLSLSDDNGTIAIVADQAGSQTIEFPVQGGSGTVSASMFLYRDANYNQPFNGVPVLSTDDMLYIKIALTPVLNGIYIIARQCWATPDAAGSSSERFDFIELPGCMKSTVTNGLISSNGVTEESRFQFQVFKFLPTNVVYIHCQVELCITSNGGTCQPTCPANRRRRDTIVTTHILRSTLIIKSTHKVSDPYETPWYNENTDESEANDNVLLIAILVGLLVLMMAVVVVVVFYLCRVRRRKSTYVTTY